MARYDPQAIERKWQQVWEAESTWEVANPGEPGFDDSKPKTYVLEMLPYPSGEPHVGHLKNYSVGDAIAHFRRRHGFEVLHPMGYDAFGLPAENDAIKTGEHPREATERLDRVLPRAVPRAGASRSTGRARSPPTSPRYYRWTQWIFLQLFERGLAYRDGGAGRLVPEGRRPCSPTSRSIDGRCERCGTLGRAARPRAVVLPDHRLRRPAARRLRRCSSLARARDHDAAQLDRPLRGRRGRLPLRGARARLPRLHHPPRHAVRRDVLRAGARAPGRRAAGRRHRARGGGARRTSTRAARESTEDRARRGAREDRRAARAARSSTRSTASGSRSSSPTTC